MAISMSSRFLFSAGRSLTDLESPPDSPQKKMEFLIPVPLPRVPLPRFGTKHSLLLSLLLLFLWYRTQSRHGNTLWLPLSILLIAYLLFKNRPRLPLPLVFKKIRPTFFIAYEDINTKKSRRLNFSPTLESTSNGSVYAGEFHKGSRTGKGVIKIPRKSTYMGDWIGGAYDGYGVERLVGCGEYKGKFWKGARHGFGSMRFSNGDRYNGEWRYGERDGMGEQTCVGGSSYVGEFKKGMKHGLGIYHFRNGDIYLGEYFSDKLLGFGVYSFANGDYYHGSWHDGRMAGYGVYTMRDGDILSGMWINGAIVTPISPSVHRIQKSVKAARTAAQRSRDLPRVEYHVCQAIYAACNAAKAARLVSTAVSKEKGLHQFDPRQLIFWVRRMYANRVNGELQVKGAKKVIRELSYCLQSSAPSICTAFQAFRRLSGRCGALLAEVEQVHEEYPVSQPDSRSTAEGCNYVLSSKKSK